MRISLWIVTAAIVCAAPSYGEGVAVGVAPTLTPINEAVDGINGALRGDNDALIRQKADMFAEGLPKTQIEIRVPLHPWKVDARRDDVGQVGDLISAADRGLHLDRDHVPSPEVEQSLKYIQDVDGQGRISFQKLPDNVAGIYFTHTGLVGLSHYMPYLARKMDAAVLASVLFHEVAGHAEDPNVKTGTVEENEGLAFLKQWQYLHDLFPTGEEMGTLVLLRRQAYKEHPTQLNKVALGLAETLDALWGTGGDPQKIEALVHKLYKNDGSPSTPSA